MNVVNERSSWIETANAANATATATRAAPSANAGGVSHYITSISASSNMSATGILLTLKQGTTEKGRWYVHDREVLAFSSPIKLDPGTAANLEFAAAGVGATGAVTMTGYTL